MSSKTIFWAKPPPGEGRGEGSPTARSCPAVLTLTLSQGEWELVGLLSQKPALADSPRGGTIDGHYGSGRRTCTLAPDRPTTGWRCDTSHATTAEICCAVSGWPGMSERQSG